METLSLFRLGESKQNRGEVSAVTCRRRPWGHAKVVRNPSRGKDLGLEADSDLPMFEGLETALERREAHSGRLSLTQRLVLFAAIGAVSMALTAAGRGIVAEPVVVPTPSMIPTIPTGSRVLVFSESLFRDHPGRGDIVVFTSPDDHGQRLVKRIIAVEGETVASSGGVVTINGEPLNEMWLKPGTVTEHLVPTEVPSGHYFVMGDSRAVSIDSRRFGPIPAELIKARAGAVVAPLRHLRGLMGR